MKTPSRRDIGLLLVSAVCFMAIGWAIKSIFTPKPVQNFPIDLTPYNRAIDSLKALNSEKDTKILLLKVRFDSLNIAKEINHSNLNHNVAKTRTFTPTASKRYMDSVYRAESR
jgi:hypothetical protein